MSFDGSGGSNSTASKRKYQQRGEAESGQVTVHGLPGHSRHPHPRAPEALIWAVSGGVSGRDRPRRGGWG